MDNTSQKIKNELFEFFKFRFEPDKDLAVATLTYLALVGTLYMAFQVVTTKNVALNFILYGPISMFLLGIAIPIAYNTIYKKRPLSATGITRNNWILSLALGLVFGVVTYFGTLNQIQLPPIIHLVPLITMSMTTGLFEAVFFRGWIQLRFEKAFGAIPAILIGAAFYSIYHIGYGMAQSEIFTLFILGVIFATAFRITKNILILWPFYTWIGGLYTVLSDGLTMPFEATYGFLNVVGWSLVFIFIVAKKYKMK